MIGFITLTGIASRNGILKISHYINLALNENMPFGRELVVRGSLERMTPVLMTALAAGFALLPLMIDAGCSGEGGAAPRGDHHLWRLDQRHAARQLSRADPLLAVRSESGACAFLKAPGRQSRTAGSVQPMPTSNNGGSIMRPILTLLSGLLIVTAAFAHGPSKGPNGGPQVDAGDYHVEMVAKDTALTVYLHDENDKPSMQRATRPRNLRGRRQAPAPRAQSRQRQ